MTALEKYVRLEALGSWRERPADQAREVVVSLGRSTLLLKDLADRPLGHWALAGVVWLGQDGGAATYSMTADGAETLTIRDREMIEAIASLSRPRLAAGPASRARRRGLPIAPLLALAALASLAAAAPRLIRTEAAALVPPERAAELGDRLLIHLIERGGAAPCADPGAARALEALAAKLAPDAPPRVRVLALGTTPAALLPGGTLILDRALVRTAPPAEIAGWAATALAADPLATVLAGAGPAADVRYLLTGHLGEAALARAAEAITVPPAAPAPSLGPEPLLDASARRALAEGCG
jgi:hypothetical protein